MTDHISSYLAITFNLCVSRDFICTNNVHKSSMTLFVLSPSSQKINRRCLPSEKKFISQEHLSEIQLSKSIDSVRLHLILIFISNIYFLNFPNRNSKTIKKCSVNYFVTPSNLLVPTFCIDLLQQISASYCVDVFFSFAPSSRINVCACVLS